MASGNSEPVEMLVFGKNLRGDFADEEKTIQCGADCRGVEAGRSWSACCRGDAKSWDQRADVLLMESEVRGTGSGSGSADEAAATANSKTGYSYASFLLGAFSSASFEQNAFSTFGSRKHPFSAYVQDDYKVNERYSLR
jgi:hypothetical protein